MYTIMDITFTQQNIEVNICKEGNFCLSLNAYIWKRKEENTYYHYHPGFFVIETPIL